MLAIARRCIAFIESPRLAIIFASLVAVAAPYPVVSFWLGVGLLAGLGILAWYILMELNQRASTMLRSLVYENLSFEFFYEANGDFRSRCFFKLRNNGADPVAELPVTRAFFLSDGSISSVRFRAIDEGHGIYRFQKNGQSIVDAVSALFKTNARFVEWEYEISPPLRSGESVSYEVAIETQGSEREAFTSAGSIMGFPANIPIRSALLRAVAPHNFRFVCIGHPIAVDIDLKAEAPSADISLPEPTLSLSSEILEWKIGDLPSGNRYWIKFRFERVLFDGA